MVKDQEVDAWLRNLDPVFIVPEIASSILKAKDGDTRKEERVWVRIWEADTSERSEQDMVMEGRCWCEANEKHLSSALFHSLMWGSLVRIAAWVLASLCDTLCHCIDRLAIARSPIGEHKTFS
ncbi:hypothetical protein E3N88_32921 [Mikania micrantha]|uniref:Uncharacterized protein n=1 Tax=Mikania micrantha TaxID=192012 RepID=A0A5N6MB28_9ASTR|nr:hypothetical protein E3N88_32921 [Mikania micrantha]